MSLIKRLLPISAALYLAGCTLSGTMGNIPDLPPGATPAQAIQHVRDNAPRAPVGATAAQVTEATRRPFFIVCDERQVNVGQLAQIASDLTLAQIRNPLVTTNAGNREVNGIPLSCGARVVIISDDFRNVQQVRIVQTQDRRSVSVVEWRQPNGFVITFIDPEGGFRSFTRRIR